jgi:hypothetical protein
MAKLILLTGARLSGKDTFAELAKEIFPDRVASAAIADWFKRLLAHATGDDLSAFYDARKDQPYATPVILNEFLILRMGLSLTTLLNTCGIDHNIENIYRDLRSYTGREFKSRRDLMCWYGFEFIHKCFGSDEIHCLILQRLLPKEPKESDILVVTDARTYFESSWFSARWPHGDAVPVKINNPYSPVDSTGVEKATLLFPEGWFDYTLDNPAPNREAYKTMVHKVLTGSREKR